MKNSYKSNVWKQKLQNKQRILIKRTSEEKVKGQEKGNTEEAVSGF